ncbi:MAG TPA: TonB-dependent receptor [Cyclobacteriaceae bacterium]|nr:TonB-dependent receptor [Cyclobacteriaceae bacterium]
MKKSIFISFSFFLSITLFAQESNLSQTVKGKITDTDTEAPLIGVYVILAGSNPLKGAITDINGNFSIGQVPVGRQSFKITCVGYEEASLNDLLVTSGSELILNVSLREAVAVLNEVVIRPEDILSEPINSMSIVSSQRITMESTSRIAAGINDPGRTVQSYAGVSSFDDENNEIVVRGNSPRGMLWRMEGVEIPNPNHFSNGEGGSGGGVSALSTQVIDDSDFLSGAFPAEYGNALSSVFDLHLRTGNYDKREYAFQAGVLGLQAALEGPLCNKSEASYLVNYRYSTLTILGKLGIDIGDSDIQPEWQDLSLNINIPSNKLGRFNIWGLGGISSQSGLAEKDTSLWQYRSDGWEDYEKHYVGIGGITHQLQLNSATYLRTVLSVSYTDNIVNEDSLSYDLVPTLTKDESFVYQTYTASSLVNHKFNAKNVVRVGVIYTHQLFELDTRDFNWEAGQLEKQIDQSGNTGRYQAYLQWKWRPGAGLDVNTGVHLTYLAINRDEAIEPRFGIKWSINDNHSISYGAGLHSKSEPISIYMAERQLTDGSVFNPNRDVKMTKAFHNAFAYDWRFLSDFHFRAEVYYQHLFDVPVQPADSTGVICALNFASGFTNESFENEGTGRNYGLELTLEKYFSNHYYFMTTASLFESKYTMPDGIERNTLFNSKYIYNIVGGKEFEVGREKQNLIGANFRMIWRGGYRTVPVDLEASIASHDEVRDYDKAFETKAPDYFRMDIGLSYRKNNPAWSWILSLDIQNMTDRQNVWDEYYHAESSVMRQVLMVGLLPILNFKVEF